MHDYPLLDAIYAPLPIYKHCTLQEIIILGSGVLGISLLLFPIATFIICGSAWLGLVIALPLSFVLTRLAIGYLAHLKYGKPHGYYQQYLRGQLSRLGVYRSPYITRVGRWSVGRNPL